MLLSQIAANFTDASDTDLVAAIVAGREAAFTVLMRRFNRPLYRTARAILKDDTEAEDVLQDAYLLAYRGMKSFRGGAKLSTWLTRIVVNEALARLRKARGPAAVVHLSGAEEGMSSGADTVDDRIFENPERVAMRAQVRSMLEKKIDALPDVFRTVFVLRALEEMTVTEVSQCLAIPAATVRSRFMRARGMLRESMARDIDFAFDEAFSFDGARCDRIVSSVLSRVRGLVTPP